MMNKYNIGNREMGFKAWDKKKKEMTLNDSFYELQRWNRAEDELRDFVIMQYTGLKGENENKIYEGDIVEYSDEEDDEPCIVIYKQEACAFFTIGAYSGDVGEILPGKMKI